MKTRQRTGPAIDIIDCDVHHEVSSAKDLYPTFQRIMWSISKTLAP